ncbi:MAG: hypothetical protein JWP34_5317 [Massilia sp.]|nr:hypothetical protein [Massilia sp.]
MICSTISEMIGFACYPLCEDGSVAMIETPFLFSDGDEIPVFVEKLGPNVRFFDDGAVIMHFMGRGVTFDDHRKTRFLKNIAEPNGVTLSESGELEIWANTNDAPTAFARYMATMLALTSWESEQTGASTDASLFLEEVAMCLRAWKTGAEVRGGQEYTGVSGHIYKMDFHFDGTAVLAIGLHPASISSAAKKLLDIRAGTENQDFDVLIVMDDRQDADTAKREGLVLDSVGSVMMMTKLEKASRLGLRPN